MLRHLYICKYVIKGVDTSLLFFVRTVLIVRSEFYWWRTLQKHEFIVVNKGYTLNAVEKFSEKQAFSMSKDCEFEKMEHNVAYFVLIVCTEWKLEMTFKKGSLRAPQGSLDIQINKAPIKNKLTARYAESLCKLLAVQVDA